MNGKQVSRVFVFADLAPEEWRALEEVTRLSVDQPHSYVFEPPSNAAPDIYLVDGDHIDPQNQWFSAHARHPAPTVFLTADLRVNAEKREFPRPLTRSNISELRPLLQRAVAQGGNTVSELFIGREDEEPALSFAVTDRSQMRYSALVVDDSSTVRAQVGLGLRIFGVAADFAESAEQAFELLAAHSYDIAFLDVVLPGSDGYQICKAIKKSDRSRNTTVIMLTSKSSTFDRVKASLAGCDTFLTKPVQNALFQKVLSEHLGDRNAAWAPS